MELPQPEKAHLRTSDWMLKDWNFPTVKIRIKADIFTFCTSLQHYTMVPTHCNKSRKKYIIIRKKEKNAEDVKTSVVIRHDCVHRKS